MNEHVIAQDDDGGNGTNARLSLENNQIDSADYARAYYKAIDPNDEQTTLADWKQHNGFDSGTDQHVTFRDRVDLGYGRDMYARTRDDGSLAIYVDNYIVQLGEGDVTTYGPLGLDAALARDSDFLIGSNTIEFSPIDINDPNSEKVVKMATYDPKDISGSQKRALNVDLDGRGNKFMPTACLTCHGGAPYPLNPDGSFPARSLLSIKMNILDPSHFTFSTQSGFSSAESQPAMKAINQMVHGSYAVANNQDDSTTGKWNANLALDLAAGAYGGDFSINSYDLNYVPPGWRQTANRPEGVERLYLEVVKEHCIACHSLLGTNAGENSTVLVNGEQVALANFINFASYEKFILGKSEIIKRVYKRAQMPLSLLNYTEFWADPSGAPTLLASFLPGFNVFDESGEIAEPKSPVAIPGSGRRSTSPVTINASPSLLADSFSWRLSSTPTDAVATLSSFDKVNTTLTADTDGTYIVGLSVTNGIETINTDIVIVIDSNQNPVSEALTFADDILPILTDCAECHVKDGAFPGIPLLLTTANPHLYKDVREQVNFDYAASSTIVVKPTGAQHGEGVKIDRQTPEGERAFQTILNWISNGAPCGQNPLVCDTAP